MGATPEKSSHSQGLDLVGEAIRIAKSRQGEKPAGEYRIGGFILDTDTAFTQIEERLTRAMDLLLVPKAQPNLKGGVCP